MYFNRKAQYFLSRRGALISSLLFSKILNQPLLYIQSRKSQETLYAITHGVTSILMGVIGSIVIVVSDLSALVVLAIGLFLVDPKISLAMFIIFSLIGVVLYLMLHNRAHKLGDLSTKLSVQSSQQILEVFETYREAVVRNRRFYYAEKVGKLRFELANMHAEMQFMPSISKYALEIAIVIGALLLSAFQFMVEDSTQAVTNLVIFLAAGARIAPAILRIQQGAVAIKGNLGFATPTLEIIEDLKDAELITSAEEEAKTDHSGFVPEIVIENASVLYPGSSQPAIRNITLSIPRGSVTAIVGPSGAGKSTLVDLILGVIAPDTGTVKISGMSPAEVVKSHPGSMAYVPQEVSIIDGTIYENIVFCCLVTTGIRFRSWRERK
jgi:ABC-type multidrug transport system fused ATPase/permease subunit